MASNSILVCDECDVLFRQDSMNPGDVAVCSRCGHVLLRHQPNGLRLSLVFALTAAVLFVISNAFPIVGLTSQGLVSSTSLIGMVDMLFRDDMPLVAGLVFITTFLMPALEISAFVYLLLPMRLGRLPPKLDLVFRIMHLSQPWAMIEVFMLGLLVTISKLHAMATVVPEIALWSFVMLMISLTAAAANFDARTFWDHVETLE
jgi:paraquat-inducible protein A